MLFVFKFIERLVHTDNHDYTRQFNISESVYRCVASNFMLDNSSYWLAHLDQATQYRRFVITTATDYCFIMTHSNHLHYNNTNRIIATATTAGYGFESIPILLLSLLLPPSKTATAITTTTTLTLFQMMHWWHQKAGCSGLDCINVDIRTRRTDDTHTDALVIVVPIVYVRSEKAGTSITEADRVHDDIVKDFISWIIIFYKIRVWYADHSSLTICVWLSSAQQTACFIITITGLMLTVSTYINHNILILISNLQSINSHITYYLFCRR